MCFIKTPKITQPTQYQSARQPDYPDGSEGTTKGRRGTILTGSSGVVPEQSGGKKTLLGQ